MVTRVAMTRVNGAQVCSMSCRNRPQQADHALVRRDWRAAIAWSFPAGTRHSASTRPPSDATPCPVVSQSPDAATAHHVSTRPRSAFRRQCDSGQRPAARTTPRRHRSPSSSVSPPSQPNPRGPEAVRLISEEFLKSRKQVVCALWKPPPLGNGGRTSTTHPLEMAVHTKFGRTVRTTAVALVLAAGAGVALGTAPASAATSQYDVELSSRSPQRPEWNAAVRESKPRADKRCVEIYGFRARETNPVQLGGFPRGDGSWAWFMQWRCISN